MKKQSAGILLYRVRDEKVEVLLVHPGGPFWARKDFGAWSIPKGEFLEDEEPFHAAQREFTEELGMPVPEGKPIDLGSVQQSGSKTVFSWAIEADLDVASITCNTFELEWPPKSGQMKQYPEVDKAAWFGLDRAVDKIVKGQVPILEKLATILKVVITPAQPEEKSITPTTSKAKKSFTPPEGQTSLL